MSTPVKQTMPIESRYCYLNGFKVHYQKTGTGRHHVLMMPGVFGSAETDFPYQTKNMDTSKFTLIAWDPPGYGRSIPPERKWVGNIAKQDGLDAVELMEFLEIERYSIIGWSLGGVSAKIIGALYPERILSIVSMSSKAFYTNAHIKVAWAISDITSWLAGSLMVSRLADAVNL